MRNDIQRRIDNLDPIDVVYTNAVKTCIYDFKRLANFYFNMYNLQLDQQAVELAEAIINFHCNIHKRDEYTDKVLSTHISYLE